MANNKKGRPDESSPKDVQHADSSASALPSESTPAPVAAHYSHITTTGEAQRQRILEMLRTGQKTTLDFRRAGVMQSQTRIFELRAQGFDIPTVGRVTVYDDQGFPHHGDSALRADRRARCGGADMSPPLTTAQRTEQRAAELAHDMLTELLHTTDQAQAVESITHHLTTAFAEADGPVWATACGLAAVLVPVLQAGVESKRMNGRRQSGFISPRLAVLVATLPPLCAALAGVIARWLA